VAFMFLWELLSSNVDMFRAPCKVRVFPAHHVESSRGGVFASHFGRKSCRNCLLAITFVFVTV